MTRLQVYAVALPKGGTGKSTTTAELARHLVLLGKKVLALDLDRQANLTTRLGVPTAHARTAPATAKDVLLGTATAAAAAITSPAVHGVDVIVPGTEIRDLESRPEALTALRDYLPELAGEWDAVVIDTPPADGMATLAALAAADHVIAPVACETEAFDQAAYLQHLIDTRIAPRIRKGQRVHWIIPTRYDGRRVLDREILEELQRQFPDRVTSPIREAQGVKDSFTAGLPVSAYTPEAPVAADYRAALTTITKNTHDIENTQNTYDADDTTSLEGAR